MLPMAGCVRLPADRWFETSLAAWRPLELPGNLEPIYTNFAVITHSPSEFILDFARALPNMRARVQTRIVMTPLNAKLLLNALTENLEKFEAQFGEIIVPT